METEAPGPAPAPAPPAGPAEKPPWCQMPRR
uniref:Uncharacterized protein n=1 Tax=Arundo donax TaxID=35708 RepID=A0A0A9F8R4_ARUDO